MKKKFSTLALLLLCSLLDASEFPLLPVPAPLPPPPSDYQFTRLHKAVLNNEVAEVASLLAARADVNKQDPKFGDTALHKAGKRQYLDIWNLLLAQKETDVEVRNHNRKTPLCVAFEKVFSAGVQSLAEQRGDAPCFKEVDEDGQTFLFLTTKQGMADALLHGGTDPEIVSVKGQTALQIAELSGHAKVAASIRNFIAEKKRGPERAEARRRIEAAAAGESARARKAARKQDREICPICQYELDEAISPIAYPYTCGHGYHESSCAKQLIEFNQRRCSTCRNPRRNPSPSALAGPAAPATPAQTGAEIALMEEDELLALQLMAEEVDSQRVLEETAAAAAQREEQEEEF